MTTWKACAKFRQGVGTPRRRRPLRVWIRNASAGLTAGATSRRRGPTYHLPIAIGPPHIRPLIRLPDQLRSDGIM